VSGVGRSANELGSRTTVQARPALSYSVDRGLEEISARRCSFSSASDL
jgi:hypothetical protein